jgi:hypothetical protein
MGKIAGRPILVERDRRGGRKGKTYAVGSYDRNGKLDINTMSAGSNPTQAKYNYLESMDMLPGSKNDYTRNSTPAKPKRSPRKASESDKIAATRQKLTEQRNREIKSQIDQDPQLKQAVDFLRGPKASDRKFMQSSGLSQEEAIKTFDRVRQTLGIEPGQDTRKAVRDLYGRRKKRSDSFAAGYADVMRLDFAIAPTQDAVVFAGDGMIVLTFHEPPNLDLQQELFDLRRQVSDDMAPMRDSTQRSFYIPLLATYCPDRTAEAIANDLESRYGMRVLRKRSRDQYQQKHGPKVVKRFTKDSAFSAGYADAMSA